MSRIDNMIIKYCPNGVKFHELQKIFITRNGYTPSTTNKAYWENETVPWFRMEDIRENGQILSSSMRLISEYAVKGGRLFPANSIIIATSATIGEHALITVPHLANQRFTSLSLKPAFSDRLDMRFVFYYCFVLDRWCLNNTTTSSFSSVNMGGFNKFKIPIPPLSIQQEIVKALDAFTELEAELKAELKARRKQYSYYRDKLCDGGSWKTLGEIGAFVRGNGLQKKDFTDGGVGCIHYGQIYTHYGTFADKTKSFVSESFAKKMRKAHTGDLIIATTSENDEDVCKAVAWLGEDEIAISGDAYIYRHSLHPKYAAYFFQTDQFQKQKKRHISGTKVKRVSGNNMGKFLIPVPSMEEQERIVSILDKFDMLVNDLSEGLPAEITARRRQYEHYRNRLLTFQEASG